YLGGVSATTLAGAGRVHERRAGALARADAMLASAPAPFCRTGF
ncbi:MAG: GNAT family N-acetyltransferase, partial [Actinomycetota bacterium]|nr:GNAT family N-acetyltransferase [Actinomycetota bacterium]